MWCISIDKLTTLETICGLERIGGMAAIFDNSGDVKVCLKFNDYSICTNIPFNGNCAISEGQGLINGEFMGIRLLVNDTFYELATSLSDYLFENGIRNIMTRLYFKQ